MTRYIHGTDPDEQMRLARLNDVLNGRCLRELELRPGQRVLDVGSGLGQLARGMARATGVQVVGVERSHEQIAEARRLARAGAEEQLVEFRQGEATDLPAEHFDVAHARFVLEHLTDPLACVRSMVAAVRPGGRIVLADDDHQTFTPWPEPAGFAALWDAYARSYDRLGNDPRVGRRLVELLHEAGARPVRNTLIFFGSCAGSPEWPTLMDNLVHILEQVRHDVVDRGLLTAAAFDDAIAALRQLAGRPDGALWYGMCWAEGVRP